METAQVDFRIRGGDNVKKWFFGWYMAGNANFFGRRGYGKLVPWGRA
ncbi:unnamed protein product, partial [Rotaria sp. Silwood1]